MCPISQKLIKRSAGHQFSYLIVALSKSNFTPPSGVCSPKMLQSIGAARTFASVISLASRGLKSQQLTSSSVLAESLHRKRRSACDRCALGVRSGFARVSLGLRSVCARVSVGVCSGFARVSLVLFLRVSLGLRSVCGRVWCYVSLG